MDHLIETLMVGEDQENPASICEKDMNGKDGFKVDYWSGKWKEKKLSRAQLSTLKSTLNDCEDPKALLTLASGLDPAIRAAAEVTRMASEYWIDHPEIKTGAEIVAAIERQSSCRAMGGLPHECDLVVKSLDWKEVLKQRISKGLK